MSEQKKQSNWEISAGGVVCKKESDSVFILLIKPSGQTANQDSVWTFPKGHIDEDTPEDAAVREVREEGGVNAKIIESLGSYKYTFVWDGENISKIVTYYLMEYISGEPSDHDHEVEEAKWFEINEAENAVSYEIDKEVMAKVKDKVITY